MTFTELMRHAEVISNHPVYEPLISYNTGVVAFILGVFSILFVFMFFNSKFFKFLIVIPTGLFLSTAIATYQHLSTINNVDEYSDLTQSYKKLSWYFYNYGGEINYSSINRRDLSDVVYKAKILIKDTENMKEKLELLGVQFEDDKVMTFVQADKLKAG